MQSLPKTLPLAGKQEQNTFPVTQRSPFPILPIGNQQNTLLPQNP
jgi:hypothetical protein